MFKLTYEQRKSAIFEFLYRDPGGLLHRYKLPEHLSEDAIRDEINLLVEDINRLIPNEQTEDDLRLLLSEINSAIRRRHGAQGWPSAKVFMAATEDALIEVAKKKAASSSALNANRDQFDIIAAKMRASEPVGEGYLWGRQAVELIARGLVDQTTMESYRRGAFESRRERYGEDAAMRWESEAKTRHLAAKEAYRQRKNERLPLDQGLVLELQADLTAVGAALDRRTREMRSWT